MREKKVYVALKDVVLIALMVATLEAVKIALSFLPNVELVTLLIMLYTKNFGKKIVFVIPLFIAFECLQWGFGIWTFIYAYVWFILAAAAIMLRKQSSPVIWAVIGGTFGLLFGLLCAIPYLFIGGVSMAFAWWISGIPYDFIHCVANFVLALVLFKPLDIALIKLKQRYYS